jgi:hypothetical protein
LVSFVVVSFVKDEEIRVKYKGSPSRISILDSKETIEENRCLFIDEV